MTSAGTVITGAVIMAALVYKAIDLVKYIAALFGTRSAAAEDPKAARRDAQNGLITLGLGAAVGIGVVMLMAHTLWSNEIKIGAVTLQGLSAVEQVVLGLVITSLAAVLFDVKKAIDGTDTASAPKVLPGPDRTRREHVAAKMSPPKDEGPKGDGEDALPLRKDLEGLRMLKDHLRQEKEVIARIEQELSGKAATSSPGPHPNGES